MSFTRTQTFFSKLRREGALPVGGRILDLGCGKGADSIFLADNDYIVDSVDNKFENITYIQSQNKPINAYNANIENFKIEENAYQITIASLSLQILKKEAAKRVIQSMVGGCVKGGIIFLSITGKKDDSIKKWGWSFWTKNEILKFLRQLPVAIRNIRENEGLGETISGGIKYWHYFEFILIKQ